MSKHIIDENVLNFMCQNVDVFVLLRRALMRADVRKIANMVCSQEAVVDSLCERHIPPGDTYEQCFWQQKQTLHVLSSALKKLTLRLLVDHYLVEIRENNLKAVMLNQYNPSSIVVYNHVNDDGSTDGSTDGSKGSTGSTNAFLLVDEMVNFVAENDSQVVFFLEEVLSDLYLSFTMVEDQMYLSATLRDADSTFSVLRPDHRRRIQETKETIDAFFRSRLIF